MERGPTLRRHLRDSPTDSRHISTVPQDPRIRIPPRREVWLLPVEHDLPRAEHRRAGPPRLPAPTAPARRRPDRPIVLLLNSGTYLIPGVVPWGPWRYAVETATIVPLLWRETYPGPRRRWPRLANADRHRDGAPGSAFPVRGPCHAVHDRIGDARPDPGDHGRGCSWPATSSRRRLHQRRNNPEDFFVTFALSLTALFLGVLMQSERDSLSVRADRALQAERARIPGTCTTSSGTPWR